MNSIKSIWIVILVLLALFVVGWQQKNRPTQWEYTSRFISQEEVANNKATQILNEYGGNRWELVAISTGSGDMRGLYYFKRPR